MLPRLAVLVLAGTLLGACDDTCPTGEGTGALDLDVSGLPGGVEGAVDLVGPTPVAASTGGTVSDLAIGSYSVEPRPIGIAESLVRAAYSGGPAESVCIREGGTAGASVRYARVPSSARLWLTTNQEAGELPAFAAQTLRFNAEVPALVRFASGPEFPSGSARGLAFDRAGNLWVSENGNRIRRYPAASLGDSGSPKNADVLLTGTALGVSSPGPTELALDAAGNLWVTVASARKVIRFSPDQLLASGNPVPGVELSGFGAPSALAFDAAGNLFVGDGNRVLRFDATALQATSTAPAALRMTVRGLSTDTILTSPDGLAFDASGHLWVAFYGQRTVVRLDAADLQQTDELDLTPSVQLRLPEGVQTHALAFDEEGFLWTPYVPGSIARLSPTQLAIEGGADVVPEVVVTSPDIAIAEVLAIYPAPAFTPLHHRLP